MAAPLLLLAPLRGVTQLEFRTCLARHFPGFDFAYSPFIPTMAGPRFKMSALRDVMPEPNAAAIPVIPQAIGKSPADFATLVSALKDLGYNRCDLNAGCPWPMIVKRGRGSGLLKSPDLLFAMLDAACAVMPEGISLKARLGVEDATLLPALMERLNQYPLSALTIHARTARQMYEGKPDLETFGHCLADAKMPVIYNGDINTPEDAAAIVARFPNVSGLMIGRGAVRDPTLAMRIKGNFAGDRRAALADFVRDYSEVCRARLCGPGHFLGRMKEFWSYFKDSFEDGEKLWRQIRISRTYSEYDAVLSGL